MGQTPSASLPSYHSGTTDSDISEVDAGFYTVIQTEKDLILYFSKRINNLLKPVELFSFNQKFLKLKETKDIDCKQIFTDIFCFPENIDSRLINLFNRGLRRLSIFPLLNDKHDALSSKLTLLGCLMSCFILSSPENAKRLVNNPHYNYIKLIFIFLSTPSKKNNTSDKEKGEEENTETSKNTVKDLLATFDGVTLQDRYLVSGTDMLLFLTLVTSISHYTLLKHKLNPQYIANKWNSYQRKPALNLLRTMNNEIDVTNIRDMYITYEQFETAISTTMPNLLKPLNNLFLSLFEDWEVDDPNHTFAESKLMTLELRSQIATYVPPESIYASLQKLYVGREVGFSMRSFQSKVFNWNAPTVILIHGSVLNNSENDDVKNDKPANGFTANKARYVKFLESYPKLKANVDYKGNGLYVKGTQVTLAVYVNEPWKVTNKTLFGDGQSKITELAPIQLIHKSVTVKNSSTDSKSVSGNIYFNTVGGGIGIGNKLQPHLKGTTYKKYHPGNVSLTIDSALEFGAFRNVGYGGLFAPGDSYDNDYEYVFIIKDLEVWGCGGKEQLQEQLQEWEWEEREAKRRQRINLKSMGEDRALLEMAGLIGQHNQSGGSI
ncbi:Rtc5p SCDLUD_003212 [Saccharomycodes ludwigii]|uniref:Rtc5p n=1 Tax=Saccharomycodes ludwigii TaxID=36035 RepID=UPI001E875805|nr:hypothetical protein SCDLUD_003212 [Saccharomycodes ludwigii]KAH3900241.1 hypothetical protein SCDLUD_003212 [Saccharomycodes ludwigii]